MSWPFLSGSAAVAAPVERLTASGEPIFRRAGKPWRQRSVTAFPLATLHAQGQDIRPFLSACKGFNMLRLFPYVDWPGTGWKSPSHAQWRAFVQDVAAEGFDVEISLLTSDEPEHIQPAIDLV